MLAFVILGCSEEDKLGVTDSINTKKMPQLSTRNVCTLVSDSGFTKYKVVTPLWNVYNGRDRDAFWDFPKGVYLRQLDHNLKVVATVAADSACYFPAKKLWELYGDVEIEQKDKVYFYSPRVFFDDKEKRIFSDAFIHIETDSEILEGKGFESNTELTRYRVLKPTGVFPAGKLERKTERQASLQSIEQADESFAPSPEALPNFPSIHDPENAVYDDEADWEEEDTDTI